MNSPGIDFNHASLRANGLGVARVWAEGFLPLVSALMMTLFAAATLQAQGLPGTGELEPGSDFSAEMVAGIDRFAVRLTEESVKHRHPNRQRLREILGVCQDRTAFNAFELVADTNRSALLFENERTRVMRVRWPVFEGIHGEGILIQPKGPVLARVVYLPDADVPPERLVDDILLSADCEIVIPMLLSRATEWSGNERLGMHTNQSHREWIYRQSFELGRHIIGYELQKTLAVVDWFRAQPCQLPVLVAGIGEGGLLALHAAAIDPRIDAAYVAGYFGPREALHGEPIYRNVFGILRDFGDAEVASLIAPRPLAVQHLGFPKVSGPAAAKGKQRSGAAPGVLSTPPIERVRAEVERARVLSPGEWIQLYTERQGIREIVKLVFPQTTAAGILKVANTRDTPVSLPIDAGREKRQVRELETFAQREVLEGERERETSFWKPLPLGSVPAFEERIRTERERFWSEVIGRLPDPDVPAQPRSRRVRETEKVIVYEVRLEVWSDVFAQGWLCVPKNLAPDERRPVVVCQHGLEGLPADTFESDQSSRAWGYYKSFALRLAEEGFVTFAPHNPYKGGDAFRVLQRKLNPLGLTLFSVMAGQHQRLLEWLKAQPFVAADKIAFYGLSYGGKAAMRLPALLPDYCLSICSGDFNEWVRKCVSTDLPMSYLYTGEYEIWEWNMGRTFNYAEMAALIAPRPFMVERGHNDGVGVDEWVDYEFAKVRRLYDKLGIGNKARIEHFDGPHTIHGRGTFDFLKAQLGLAPK